MPCISYATDIRPLFQASDMKCMDRMGVKLERFGDAETRLDRL